MPTTLSFRAVSFQEPRTLRIEVNDRVVDTVRVSSDKAKIYEISQIVLPPGKNKIELTPTPPAVVIDSIVHNYDMREVSVAFDWIDLRQGQRVLENGE